MFRDAANILNDGQIAVAIGGVGNGSLSIVVLAVHYIRDGRNGNFLGLAADVVVAVDRLTDGALGTRRNTGDVNRLVSLDIDGQNVVFIGKGNGVTLCVLHRRGCCHVRRNGNCQRIRIVGIADGFGDFLGQRNAGVGSGNGELTIVAQPDDDFAVLVDIAFVMRALVIGRCVRQFRRSGVVLHLVLKHIVQTADTAGSQAQDREKLAAVQAAGHALQILRCNRLAVIQERAGGIVVQTDGFLQVAPGSIYQVGDFLCLVAGTGGTVEGNIGVDLVGIVHAFRDVRIGQDLQFILLLIPQDTVLVFVPEDGFAIYPGDGLEYFLVGLVVVITVFLTGNKTNMGIAQFHQLVFIQVIGVQTAELVGIEADRSVGFVNICVVGSDLGQVDRTVSGQNIGIHTNGVVYAQRSIGHFIQLCGFFSVHLVGFHLIQQDRQDRLVDVDTQLLGAVVLIHHIDVDIFFGIPAFTGGGVHTGSFHHMVLAVFINYIIGTAEQGNGLNILDFHILTDVIGIDQRCVFHTGTAYIGGLIGNGVENTGGQFLVDLFKGICQIRAGNIKISIRVINIGSDLGIGDSTTLVRIVVVKGPSVTGHILPVRPLLEIAIRILDRFCSIGGMETVSSVRGVHQQSCYLIGANIHAYGINHSVGIVMRFDLGLGVGSIQQSAQIQVAVLHTAGAVFILMVLKLIKAFLGSPVCLAVGQHDGNRRAAFHIVGIGQDIEASVDTGLQVGTLGITAVITQFLVIVVVSRHNTGIGRTVVVIIGNDQLNAVVVYCQRQNGLTVIVISNDGDTHIMQLQQICQQQVCRVNGALQTGHSFFVLIVHGGRGIDHQDHIQGAGGRPGGIHHGTGAQCREDHLEILAISQSNLKGRTHFSSGVQNGSISVLIDRLIHPYATGIPVAIGGSAHNILPVSGRTGVDHSGRIHRRCRDRQGNIRHHTDDHYQGQQQSQTSLHHFLHMQ